MAYDFDEEEDFAFVKDYGHMVVKRRRVTKNPDRIDETLSDILHSKPAKEPEAKAEPAMLKAYTTLQKEHEKQLAFLKELVPQVAMLRTIVHDSINKMHQDCVDDVYSMAHLSKELATYEKKLTAYTKVTVETIDF